MASFDTLVDEHIMARIVAELGGPYKALALRACSRNCRALIKAPAHLSKPAEIAHVAILLDDVSLFKRKIASVEDEYKVITHLARTAASLGRREMCELIITCCGHYCDASIDVILYEAAARGHRELCERVVELMIRSESWQYGVGRWNAERFTHIMRGAVMRGDIKLFTRAAELCMQRVGELPSMTSVMGAAISANRIDMCEMIREFARVNALVITADDCLQCAVADGNVQMCVYARDILGARDFGGMLCSAVKCERVAICAMAREWMGDAKLRDRGVILLRAMEGAFESPSGRAMFDLMREWFCEIVGRDVSFADLRKLAMEAAEYESIWACELMFGILRERCASLEDARKIANTLDTAMNRAAYADRARMCECLHALGADRYEKYLMYVEKECAAHVDGDSWDPDLPAATCALLKQWIAERDTE